MAKIQGHGFKLWSTCRRKIMDTMRCSGGMSRPRKTVQSSGTETIKIVETKSSMLECKADTVKVSESLLALMKMSECSLEEVVKRLQNGEVLRGAKEVRKLAKDDSDARTKFALLNAISPLVALLDSGDLDSQIASLYALLNLGIGNDKNKSAIVEAGVVHKMLDLVESSQNPDLLAAIVANFLGLSALDSNKPIIGSSGAILFLIKTLKSFTETNNSLVVQDCLRALYNLSILPANVLPMTEVDDFVPFLLSMIGDIEVSDRILSILSNIVSNHEGRKMVSNVKNAFSILVDVLNWVDSPNSQEKATYVLMVMAHKSYVDRQAMVEAGIMSSLLELTLLGSTLAQKRSSRILEILKFNKGKQVSRNFGGAGTTISAPLYGSTETESVDSSNSFPNNNAVKQLVEQSLQSNMKRIVKRANFPKEFMKLEHSKSTMASYSTSKSLPF